MSECYKYKKERWLIKMVEARKIKLIEHIIRHNDFIINNFEGKITGKKPLMKPKEKIF